MRQLTLFNDLILTSRADPVEASESLEELCRRGAVIGTDEAGRGALAGPVVAAAVYLTREQEKILLNRKLRDSKRLTPKGREKLFALMNEIGVLWRASMGNIARIERDNILQASLWAMSQSVKKLAVKLNTSPACIIVDGTERIPDINFSQWPLIKADDLIPVVSAASIVAKVIRDRLMARLDSKFPGYNLAKNKGYPTREHRERVKLIGLSDIHRESFCRKLLSGR